ncbi:kinase [Thraustotheca clavata]|uniref:Kinase n=1 Tax=Thraustotheca clavata TaxID=74557 RepID=A0A1V9YYW1_9STRA|nr:kinase [Thraustotheca clavata]
MMNLVVFPSVFSKRRLPTRPIINWSKVTKRTPRAVHEALNNSIVGVHNYSALAKFQWTYLDSAQFLPYQYTIVGGKCVPFHSFEIRASKAYRRAKTKKLYSIQEDSIEEEFCMWSVHEVDNALNKHSFKEKIVFNAISFPAKHGSDIMKLLFKATLSLKDMGYGHLKRMKKHTDGRLLALISPDISIANSFVSSLSNIETLEMVAVEVPKFAAMTKEEFAVGNAEWPLVFHPNVDANVLALDEKDIEQINTFGSKLFDAMAATPATTVAIGCGANHCIIVNPQTNSIVASAEEFGSSNNPLLQHAPMQALEAVSQQDLKRTEKTESYLCTGYDVYVATEPCVMCAMALVHSRVRRVLYIQKNSSSGALGSIYQLHTQRSLNHRYRAFHIAPPLKVGPVSPYKKAYNYSDCVLQLMATGKRPMPKVTPNQGDTSPIKLPSISPGKTVGMFFRGATSKKSGVRSQTEEFEMSFMSLRFSDVELEERFRQSRLKKYRRRLRFGANITAFFIPLLVVMQVLLKKNDTNSWEEFPRVIIFPLIVGFCGTFVSIFFHLFQKYPLALMTICLVGQVCALLDTTAAGTNVSEKNIWVQFIFSLGITSSTGLNFLETTFIMTCSGICFLLLAWIRYAIDIADPALTDITTLSTPGTCNVAIILYTILLGFLSWNWEYEERRDFILTERLAKENVQIQMTMEMTGWFSGGVAVSNEGQQQGIMNSNCHIDPKDVEIGAELGTGTFGSVYSARWKETNVAVKKIILRGDTQTIVTNFGAEASVMAQLRHPNVVMFMGVMLHPEYVGLVMELCPKGSLYGVIHSDELKLDWSLLLRMLLDSARGMNFLHSSSPPLIHRDLKSINLLIDADWRCKVSDFGLSKLKAMREDVFSDRDSPANRSYVGTSMWIAPEIFNGEEHTEASDVYSFGVILYEVMSGASPFESVSPDAVPFIVQSGKRPTDFAPLTPITHPALQTLAPLMTKCWDADYRTRPLFTTIIGVIQQVLVSYVDQELWEDHIIFPDRKLVTNNIPEPEDGFLITEKDVVLGEAIGKGVFGVVYSGIYFGTPVAIKKLPIGAVPKNTLAEFHKECSIMKGLHHPNIVLFMGSCSNPPNLLLVTELLVNGSFFDYYHKHDCPTRDQHRLLSYNIALDMARGLAYLHNHNAVVIHRDLKSQNILLDEKMRTKIADFGLSKFREVGKTMSICGSPLWVAPEVLRGEKYGTPCDVYSFSIIVWEVLAWSEPYPAMGSSEVMKGVACGNLRPIPPDDAPTCLANLLRDCWHRKQETRPGFNQIVPLLEGMRDEVLGTHTNPTTAQSGSHR